MTEPVLTVAGLDVAYGKRRRDAGVRVVRSLAFELAAGEVLGVVGESGSGKSSTALALLGLLPRGARVSGSVRFAGEELVGASERALGRVRGRGIALVLQDPGTALNPVHRIGAQLTETLRAHEPGLSRAAARERAEQLLAQVGIPEPARAAERYPHEFSGGMRQRVVIALAMSGNPAVLLADEPTSALDVTVQATVLDALASVRRATRAAMLLITHDLGVVAGVADRVLVMYAGAAVEVGTARDIFYRPRMPYTLGLLGSSPRLDGAGPKRLTPVPGIPPSPAALPAGCSFAPRCPMARQLCTERAPALAPTTSPGHLAACHFADELDGKAPADVFRTVATDPLLGSAT